MSKRIIEHYLLKLGSRKFWAWVVVITLATVGLYQGKLSPDAWVAATTWATGIYVGANVMQKFLSNK